MDDHNSQLGLAILVTGILIWAPVLAYRLGGKRLGRRGLTGELLAVLTAVFVVAG